MTSSASMGKSSRARYFAVRLGLLAFGALLAILLGEGALRVFAPVPFSPEVEYVPDGHLGVRLAPGRIYRLKSGGYCSINNLGFRRSGEIEYAKPEGTVRIVALGGSSTFSYDVADEETWTAVLEERLLTAYGGKIEVVNAGVPGYTVVDSKFNYLYRIRRMSPDVVIVYHTWNDMKLFRAVEAGSVLQKGVYRDDPWKTWLRAFQLAWRMRAVYHEYVLPMQRENTYADPGAIAIRQIAADGPAHRWERKNFEDLAILLAADGVLPVFASQATLLSASNLHDPAIRAVSYVEYVGLPIEQVYAEWQAVSEIIQQVATERSLPFADAFRLCPSDRDHFLDHVHLTETGNRAVAEILFRTLTEDGTFAEILRHRGRPGASVGARQ